MIQNGGTNKTALAKGGIGTLTLTANQTFTGGLTVSGGVVRLDQADYAQSLPSGSLVTVNAGGAVEKLQDILKKLPKPEKK